MSLETDAVIFVSHQIKPNSPFIYMLAGNICCSVCAPLTMTKEEIEMFVNKEIGPAASGFHWSAIDKQALGRAKDINHGEKTPNPCDHWKDRQHWFLMDFELARTTFDIETKVH
jgi:hypothetical protein